MSRTSTRRWHHIASVGVLATMLACGDDGRSAGERLDGAAHDLEAGAARDADGPREGAAGAIDASVGPGTIDGGALDALVARQPDATTAADGALDFTAFDDALEMQLALLAELEPPLRGMTAVVVHREQGVVYQRAFGAFRLDRVFLLGSSSMLLSAGVLLRLADRGLLDLDAPVSSALARWGAHKAGVTVAQLLSNSGGLPSLDELRDAEESPAAYPERAPHLCQRRAEGTLAACGRAIYEDDAPANNRPPDSSYAQGGSAWQLAGALAEQVSGRSWRALLEETYGAPCGLESLGYTNEYEREPLMHPAFYDGDPSVLAATENPNIEGGAFASAADFAKVLLMHLRDGKCGEERVLTEAASARMREDRIASWGGSTGSPIASGYGLGWYVSQRSGALSAPGVFGFYPVLEPRRGYALLIAIELDVVLAAQIVFSVKPVLDRMFPPDRE